MGLCGGLQLTTSAYLGNGRNVLSCDEYTTLLKKCHLLRNLSIQEVCDLSIGGITPDHLHAENLVLPLMWFGGGSNLQRRGAYRFRICYHMTYIRYFFSCCNSGLRVYDKVNLFISNKTIVTSNKIPIGATLSFNTLYNNCKTN